MKSISSLALSLPLVLMGCATNDHHADNQPSSHYSPSYAVYDSHDYYQQGYYNTVKFNHTGPNAGPVPPPSAPNENNATGTASNNNAGGHTTAF